MDTFTLQLPLTGEYIPTVRLTTGGVCALAGFDVDSTEDFKVCVTESLLLLKRSGYQTATIVFTVGEALGCAVTGETRGEKERETLEEEISYALLSALLGKVDFEKNDDGSVKSIAFEG